MAGCSKQFDFVFDGGLQSHTRASLINEVIKHVLYERNQIPLQFDILRQQMYLKETNGPQGSDGTGKQQATAGQNKAKNVIASLEQLFDNILKAFETCPEIQQALLLLGSSPVTPKECYNIVLPHICPEADNVTLKSSKQALFRHLVAEQVLSSDAALGPTNVYVVLCAPRFATLPGFVPKMTFKVPSRGHSLVLNMICNQPSFSAQELTMDDTEVEISGVEPFDRSSVLGVCDITPPVISEHLKSPSPAKAKRMMDISIEGGCGVLRVRNTSGSFSDTGRLELDSEKFHFYTPLTRSTPKVGCNSFVACDQNMYIWFQCSTIIKGYRI